MSQTVALHLPLNLTCNITGFPMADIEWKINGTVYKNGSDLQNVSLHFEQFDGFISSVFMIDHVVWSSAGLYKCMANNTKGDATGNFTITVGGKYH